MKQNRPATDRDVLPVPFIHRLHNASAALALGAQTAIFVGLDPQVQLPFPEAKLEIDNR